MARAVIMIMIDNIKRSITDIAKGQLACLVLGAMILACGMFNVHARCGITEGGVLGLTLLIGHWTGLSPAISEPILDGLCYLIGLKLLGRGFLKRAIIASCCYAVFYALFEHVGYLLPDLSRLPVVAALVGAAFVGLGVGLVVRAGGACGGDDALAMVMSKLSGWPIGRCYLLTDMIVLLLSLSYIPLANIACSVITVNLSSFIIGKVHGRKRHDH